MRVEYDWEDLKPIHPLWYTVLVAQVLGAAINLLMQGTANWFDVAWQGGAIATFVGFLVGLPVQAYLRPGTIAENRSMVVFVGIVSFCIMLFGLFMPLSGSAA